MAPLSPLSKQIRYLTGSKRTRKDRQAQTAAARQAAANSRAAVARDASPDAPSVEDDSPEATSSCSAPQDSKLEAALKGKAKFQARLHNATRVAKRAREAADRGEVELEKAHESLRDKNLELRAKEKENQKLQAALLKAEEDRARDREQKATYQQQIHALKARQSRVASRLQTAAERALRIFGAKTREENGGKTFHLKEKGVIPDAARDVLTELVALDSVPARKVVGAFKRIANALGVPVDGDASIRSVGRMVLEGGAAAEVQFVEAVHDGEAVTISSDGTTHKNINLESHHATVVAKDGSIQEFFLGCQQALNHTSEMQLEGWTDLIEDVYKIGSEFFGGERAGEWREFWNKLTGMMSDHAEDQKKLFRLLQAFKIRCERELRGERWVHEHFGANGLLTSLTVISERLLDDVGGVDAWEKLSVDERTVRSTAARSTYFREIGDAAFAALPDEAKVDVDFMLWSGCCMHKEMNAFKGFCTGMEGWWRETGHDGPIKLYNRDNAAAVRSAQGSSAAKRAEERSKGGAVKLVSLAGAVFRHKDRKRGQQDTLRFFFDAELGFIINFPDTSNTRFQSHADACTVLITYLDLFVEFIEYVRDNKEKGTLTNIEQNVLDGLRCPKTIREVILIVLYSQAISMPYMREIRGPFRSFDSIIDQGPLHAKVVAHLENIAADPGILLTDCIDHKLGSLDGKPWHNPEAIYAACAWVQKCSEQERADMKAQLTAACQTAIVTWRRFSSEFAVIKQTSKKNLKRVRGLANTNDANESAFGQRRKSLHNMPSASHAQLNARQMFRHNGTSKYLKQVPGSRRKLLRKIARKRDASGANKAARDRLTQHFKDTANAKRKKRAARQEKKNKAQAKIDSTIAITDTAVLDAARDAAPRTKEYLTVQQLDEQLDWYRQNWPDGPVPQTKKARGDRMQKFTLLREAILHQASQMDADDPDIVMSDVSEEAEDGMDIDGVKSDDDDFEDSDDEF